MHRRFAAARMDAHAHVTLPHHNITSSYHLIIMHIHRRFAAARSYVSTRVCACMCKAVLQCITSQHHIIPSLHHYAHVYACMRVHVQGSAPVYLGTLIDIPCVGLLFPAFPSLLALLCSPNPASWADS